MQKSIIKYMFSDMKNSIIVFTLVIVGILTIGCVMSFADSQVSFNGIGFAAMIFMFVAALSTLPMGIRYMNQSGFSRKTAYANYMVSFSLAALLVSILVQVLMFITNLITSNGLYIETEYNLLYGGTVINTFFQSIIWLFFAMIAITSMGFFISMLYQKMERNTKICVSCGFPIFFMLVLPLIDMALFSGSIYKAIMKAFMFILGFHNGEAYPLLGMGMLALISIAFYFLTYVFLVRKLNFK